MAFVVAVQELLFDFALVVYPFDFNHFGVFGELARQFADCTVPSGGKQQGLAVFRRGVNDGFDVVDKTHVEHAVGFVEYQYF